MLDLEIALSMKVPSAIAWSPDGGHIAFQVSGPEGSDIHVYALGEGKDITVTSGIPPFRLYKDEPDVRWTQDGARVIYTTGREYWSVSPTGGEPGLLFSGVLLGDLVQLSPDQKFVSFIRDGDIWVQGLPRGKPQQLTIGEGLLAQDWQHFGRLRQWPQWSPDSAKIAYLVPMDRGFKVHLISVAGETVARIVPEEDVWSQVTIDWSPDSNKVSIAKLSDDFQRKELSVFDVCSGQSHRIWLDTDDRWVDHSIHPQFDVAWSHDSRRLAFLSKRDGWRHLCVATADGAQVAQLVQGDFDNYWCSWSPDDAEVLFVSSRGNLQQRLLWSVPSGGGTPKQLEKRVGLCVGGWFLRQINIAWSPDGKQIAYVFSGPDEPNGLWVVDASGAEMPVQLYSALPEDMSERDVAHLEAVRFESADGTVVPGVLITAHDLHRDEKHPALAFMYGAWDQEAPLGWEFAPKNLIFNYLANKGYVCLLIDPRGSEGYGDAHAKGQYREGGGKQVEDVAAGAAFLANLDYVNSQGIGLFGYSYGGYMVVQTMVQAPDAFAAGVSMAPVSEWASYSGYSTYARIRFGSPDEVPNLLRERSPIYHIDKLKGTLLIVHGTHDFNVPIASAEALVKALLARGKEFEYMAYPGEGHVFVQTATVRDLIWRMERFLGTYLRRRST